MLRLAALLLIASAVAAAGAPVAAQPSADAVVATWRARQAAAARGLERIEADEALERRIDGPRGTVRVETRGTLAFDRDARRGGARRTVASARVDGEPVPPERVAALEDRLGRAFGPGFADASGSPHLIPLGRGVPERLTASDVDGRPAWRVTLAPPAGPPDAPQPDSPRRRHGRRGGGPGPHADRTEAWFTRSAETPRLLRLVVTGERPGGGTLRRTVNFAPLGALDVPEASTAALRVTQRRRLRSYTSAIAVEARYGAYRTVRR